MKFSINVSFSTCENFLRAAIMERNIPPHTEEHHNDPIYHNLAMLPVVCWRYKHDNMLFPVKIFVGCWFNHETARG